MRSLSRLASIIFGVMMLALSAAITVETIIRKLFSISFGGIDELSGYAIAVGAPLAFAVALIGQSHIRINLLHQHMPLRAKAILNAVAAATLGILAVYLLLFAVETLGETRLYRSLAQTPWATPLAWPQSLWVAALAAFAVPAVILAARALRLLVRRDWAALNDAFGPETVADELKAELDDIGRR